MQAPQWKDIEAVPTRCKTAYDRACEAANQKAQKIQESAAAPTWLKNDYDRAAQAALQGIFGCCCKCCEQTAALQAELDQKAQKSEQHEAEAEKARIQVQKEAEGCLKQMQAVTGSTGSIERSFAAATAAHYRQIGFMVSHNANAD